ncbi:MAG: hypothetical protein FJY37_10610, partial [Betaproteobacteria bacterium]|nr:hypothetical protein [Betaproteobacteria bacterium]
MRPFRLKRTITHVTVLSALLPAATALSHQVQIPIGLNGTVIMAASSTALVAHQVVPEGATLRDPASAPSRGGYVYDAFGRVVRTDVTGECVEHGLWTPELATPECEAWLFGAPSAKPAAPAANETKPAPAAKADDAFPEWIGPDEFRVGVVPLWPENEFDEPNNIGEPKMFFDAPETEDDSVDNLISEPRIFDDQTEGGVDDADLISEPRMFGDHAEFEGAGDDLISAPRSFDDGRGDTPAPDDGGMPFKEEGAWPADPYAGQFVEEQPLQEPETPWSAEAVDAADAAPSAGMSDFAPDDANWPVDKFAEGFMEEQPLAQGDDSWVIPSPLASAPDETVGPFDEDGRDPEEAISNPIMYFDTEDHGIVPPEDIIGHT